MYYYRTDKNQQPSLWYHINLFSNHKTFHLNNSIFHSCATDELGLIQIKYFPKQARIILIVVIS